MGFLFLIICPFIPKIISELFIISNKYWILETSFTAKEVLAFWGSLLGFLGTISLVILALWQNNKLAKTNDRLLRLEKNRDKPYIKILSIDATLSLENSINESLCLYCLFKNIGKGLSTDTCFVAPQIENGVTGEVTTSNNQYDDVLIDVNEEMKLSFSFSNLNISTSTHWILYLNVHTEDINSIETKQKIRITLDVINSDVRMSDVTYLALEYCEYKVADPTGN
jgi:hypothetical protein